MSLVEIARYPTRIEADLARLALEAEDIGAAIMDSEMNNFFGGAGLIGVRLMVLDKDVEAATVVLRSL